jgi:ABC-2 type transport system permease protein
LRWPRARIVAAVIRRDYDIVNSYYRVWFFEIFIGSLSLVTYYFISKVFTGISPAGLQGAPSYFDYAVVGVAITTVIAVACASLAFTVREEQLTGTLEALTAQPVTASELALGLAGYHFLFSVARAAFYLGIAAALLGADFSGASWEGAAVALVVTGVALTSIGVALGALVILFKRVEALGSVVTFGLGLLGGAFFPIAVLPGWLEAVARIVPTRLAFDSVRAALYRGEGWLEPVLGLGAFAIVSLPIALWMFGWAIGLSRRRASLTQY